MKEAKQEHLRKMIKSCSFARSELSAMSHRSPEQEEDLRQIELQIRDLVKQMLRLHKSE